MDPAGVVEPDAESLHEGQAAAAGADDGGDLLGDLEVVGLEVDVVRNQGATRADHRHARRGVRHRRPEVGVPVRVPHLLRQSLEFPAADLLQVPSRRSRRGIFVEVHRDPKPIDDGSGQVPCERDALLRGRTLERHEWDDVDRTDPGMLAAVLPQIDQLDRMGVERHDRVLQRSGVTDDGQYGPVVRPVT